MGRPWLFPGTQSDYIHMTIRKHERRQQQREQSKPHNQKRYLRKNHIRDRYGWKSVMSVDRAWQVYHTLPAPTLFHGRHPLWLESDLDRHDAANRFDASA